MSQNTLLSGFTLFTLRFIPINVFTIPQINIGEDDDDGYDDDNIIAIYV